MEAAAVHTGIERACQVIGLSRASFYRLRSLAATTSPVACAAAASHSHGLSLSPEQEEQVLATLNSERFLDSSPRQVWASLLDEGKYLCSWRTMYRLLHRHQAVAERRRVRRHPKYVRPELAATGPNQVWTWDITYLKGPIRGQFYYLYVVIDIFSRLVIGWTVAEAESAAFAVRLLQTCCQRHKVQPGQLTVHADRGAPMKSKSLHQLLCDLDVRASHGRPKVSNDNPFSEAGFKTLKYSAHFPARFGSIAAAQCFCRGYFDGYNGAHHHTGIALLTPSQLHYGEMESVLARRQATLDAQYALTPDRFRGGPPKAARPAPIVYINRPAQAVHSAVVG